MECECKTAKWHLEEKKRSGDFIWISALALVAAWMDHPGSIDFFWEAAVLHRKGQTLQVEFIGIDITLFCYPATGR
jgi:hypothetical protein